MKAPNKTKPGSVDTDSTLLTVQEVAALDRCSVKTVRRSIEAGLLQALRVGPGGRLLRVSPRAHQAYRRAQQF
jgi:excisionase family DNA binding protein